VRQLLDPAHSGVTLYSDPDVQGIQYPSSLTYVPLVVVMCGTTEFEREFILKAHSMGMTNPDYVYIRLNQIPPDNLRTQWISNDSLDAEARIAFESVLQVSQPN